MALFGSITLLPVYLQVVKGLDPTSAGLHLTPMMLGVFVTLDHQRPDHQPHRPLQDLPRLSARR